VISLGGIVTKSSIRIAGDDMDFAISWYIQKEHEIAIDTQTGEQLKMGLGQGRWTPEILEALAPQEEPICPDYPTHRSSSLRSP
jgi:rod shape-determining protein MreB